jgi:hypothetical protein
MLSNTCMLDAHPFKVDRPVIAYIYIYIYIYILLFYILDRYSCLMHVKCTLNEGGACFIPPI